MAREPDFAEMMGSLIYEEGKVASAMTPNTEIHGRGCNSICKFYTQTIPGI